MQPRASGRAAWGDGAEDDAEDDAAVEELRALLMTLLERHPARRATWEDVLDHRFWGEGGARRVQRRPLAPEPAFARLLLAARCEPSEADAIIGLARGTCAPSRDNRKHELSAWAMGDDDIALPSADTELDFRPGLVYAAPPPRSRVDDDVDHDAVLDTNSVLAEDSLVLPDAARAAGGAAAGGGGIEESGEIQMPVPFGRRVTVVNDESEGLGRRETVVLLRGKDIVDVDADVSEEVRSGGLADTTVAAAAAAAAALSFGRRRTVVADAVAEEEEESAPPTSEQQEGHPHFLVHDVVAQSAAEPEPESAAAAAATEAEAEADVSADPVPPPSPSSSSANNILNEEDDTVSSEEEEVEDVPTIATLTYEKSSALLLHSSERFLSAICGNVWIEKESAASSEAGKPTTFNSLPFRAHTSEKFTRLGSGARNEHINAMEEAISGRLPQSDKLNALRYCLSLLREDPKANAASAMSNTTDIASILTNCSLATSIIRYFMTEYSSILMLLL